MEYLTFAFGLNIGFLLGLICNNQIKKKRRKIN